MDKPYRNCAETLFEIFQRAWGNGEVTGTLKDQIEDEFEKWSEGDDNVPFITWCVEKINGGVQLKRRYADNGILPAAVRIMSPDNPETSVYYVRVFIG